MISASFVWERLQLPGRVPNIFAEDGWHLNGALNLELPAADLRRDVPTTSLRFNIFPKLPRATEEDFKSALKRCGLDRDAFVHRGLLIAKGVHAGRMRNSGDVDELEGHIFPSAIMLIDYKLSCGQTVSAEDVNVILTHDVKEDRERGTVGYITVKGFVRALGREVYNDVRLLSKDHHDKYFGRSVQARKARRDYDSICALFDQGTERAILAKIVERHNNLSSLHLDPTCDKKVRYLVETELLFMPFLRARYPFWHDQYVELIGQLTEMFALSGEKLEREGLAYVGNLLKLRDQWGSPGTNFVGAISNSPGR